MESSAPVDTAEAGQCVSLALKRVRRANIRKGMVIVHKTETPPRGEISSTHVCGKMEIDISNITAIRRFEGTVLIL